jgi:hypothetical protein
MTAIVRFGTKLGDVPAMTVDRVGGEPIGMTKETWPQSNGRPMHHVVTLSRKSIVPALPKAVAAVALFIDDIRMNEAYEPGNESSRVVFLTKSDLARGTTPAEQFFDDLEEYEPTDAGVIVASASSYEFEAVRNPEMGSTPEAELDAEEIGSAIGKYMREQRMGEVDGASIEGLSAMHVEWIQAAAAPEGHTVLFWFYEALVPDLNCGDGFMYVSANADCTSGTAWWQR